MDETDGYIKAGDVEAVALNLAPKALPEGRVRHAYGDGPFAKLKMPALPPDPGVYLWEVDGKIVYVGQTRMPLKDRLGSNGYASISNYNTFARQPGRTNGGQQTNCRINRLANEALAGGRNIVIWYRATSAEEARNEEATWMERFGVPQWNLRDERMGGARH
jgi:hypothetical protein